MVGGEVGSRREEERWEEDSGGRVAGDGEGREGESCIIVDFSAFILILAF